MKIWEFIDAFDPDHFTDVSNFYRGSFGRLLIYSGFLYSVIFIDSSINGTMVNWIRNFPIFIILQSFLLKR